jgi:hypothetical protein
VYDLSELSSDQPEFLHIVDIVSFTDKWANDLDLPEDKTSKLLDLAHAANEGEGNSDE